MPILLSATFAMIKKAHATTPRDLKRKRWVWAALAAILVVYVFSALRMRPVSTFGTYEDDTFYFSSAKALAAGQAYILPSLPVYLKGTKYPILYPLLLSVVWKIDPHFPGNLDLAIGLTLLFGCAALWIIFSMTRQWSGLGDGAALAIVVLCGFNWYFLHLSASVMSDIPFIAMTLGAVWAAERGMRSVRGSAALAAAGVLAGLAVGLRSLGVAAVAGIGVALLERRQFRRLWAFAAAALPVGLLFLWQELSSLVHARTTPTSVPLQSGWSQTICYYTSYACNWHLGVAGRGSLAAVVAFNMKQIVLLPGIYLLDPLGVSWGLFSVVIVLLLCAVAYSGMVRARHEVSMQIAFPFLLSYLAIVVIWPYTPQRFLLVFTPFFFAGMWVEGRHMAPLIASRLRGRAWGRERIIASVMGMVGLGLVSLIASNYMLGVPEQVARVARQRGALLAAEQGAYRWIRRNTGPGACVIAYEDALVYLYTGRHSIRAIEGLPQSFYRDDPRYAEHDADELANVAKHVGAGYWLKTSGDFVMESPQDFARLSQKENQLLAGMPVAFKSRDGEVTLYDVRRMTEDGGGGRGK